MKIILNSNSLSLINENIYSLQEKYQITEQSLFFFNQQDAQLGPAIFEYLAPSFSKNKKLILLRNADFLNSKKNSKNFLNYFETLFNSEASSSNDNILVFQTNKLDKKGDLYQKYQRQFQLIEMLAPLKNDLSHFLGEYLNKRQIDYSNQGLQKLISFNQENFELILREIEKLSLVASKINLDTVENFSNNFQGESIFKLLEFLIKRDFQGLELVLTDLHAKNINVILTLEYLINELQYILHFYYLNKLAINNIQFRNDRLLELNNYRLIKIKEFSRNINFERLTYLLKTLIKFKEQVKKNNPLFPERLFKATLLSIAKKP